jgi:chromosome partitioning protein
LAILDPALKLANEVAEEVRESFAETVFGSIILREVATSEAPCRGRSAMDYAPWVRVARADTELVMEVIDRESTTSRTRPGSLARA